MPLEYVNMFMLSPMCSFYPFCPTFCLEIGSSLLGSEAISRKNSGQAQPKLTLGSLVKISYRADSTCRENLNFSWVDTTVGWAQDSLCSKRQADKGGTQSHRAQRRWM